MGKYTKIELDFIKENYPKYGGKYCSIELNRSHEGLIRKATEIGLSSKNATKHDSLRPVPVNQFINPSEEICYFLGYLFADGNIIKATYGNNTTQHRIALEIQKDDAIEIQDLMMNIGKWSVQKRKRKANWKETWTYVTNNDKLYELLNSLGFSNKSNSFSKALLSHVGKYQEYFWKGFFDGDGYAGLRGRGSVIQFAGSRTFDWSELELMLKSIDVKYAIYNTSNKKGVGSVLDVCGKKSLKLINYFPDFGLQRKIIKLNNIKEKYERS